MKTKANKLFTAIAVISLALTTSCAKKGDTGPAGAQGPAGNANVISSTITVNGTNWSLSGSEWDYSYTTSSMTQNNVDKAAVMCYLSVGSGNWAALPFTVTDREFAFVYSLNSISFAVLSASGSTGISNPGTLVFKYVIIPPAMIKPNINLHNYNEVKQAYNLKD